MKSLVPLGGNGILNGIRTIFNCVIEQKYQLNIKKCSRSLSGTALGVWDWNLRGESGYVSHLSQISNTTVLFYLHPNDLRDICEKFCDPSGKKSVFCGTHSIIMAKVTKNVSSCKVGTSRYCFLNIFIKNFQVMRKRPSRWLTLTRNYILHIIWPCEVWG